MADTRQGPLQYPPVWLAAFALVAWGVGRIAPHNVAGSRTVGIALCVAGVALLIAAALTMWQARATLMPTSRPTALVTTGVYAVSRNPIYLADAVLLAGICLIVAPLAALVLVPGFIAVITARFVRREEAWLRERDPAGFAAYVARTRRWL